MKSVGKQLEEARQAKNWTPELAARETKIKIDRVRDLEADDYSHFSSPTYARGFVRTYARALGLDEYRLLRQLDNKLPEDDNATFVHETGLPYVPEQSQVTHASSSHRTGLYVFLGLACAVLFVSAFVLLQAYRAGELPRYFASATLDSGMAPATNAAPLDAEAPPRAQAVDPNDTTHALRAQPVDLNHLTADDTNTAANPSPPATAPSSATPPPVPAEPSTTTSTAAADDTVPGARRALPVDLTALTNTAPAISPTPDPTPASTPPPAPVNPTTAAAPAPEPVNPTTAAAPASSPPPDPNPASETTEKAPPRALPVDPSELEAANTAQNSSSPGNSQPSPTPAGGGTLVPIGAVPTTNADGTVITPVDLTGERPVQESMAEAQAKRRLVLTASRDSFIRVTDLDKATGNEVLYASVLRAGQSLAFGGRKFSVNVGVPSAVDIALDGVNYGPHSEGNSPETFTIESHQP
jgi:cytoskeletal protein RodZ